jgi:hypothetical protein
MLAFTVCVNNLDVFCLLAKKVIGFIDEAFEHYFGVPITEHVWHTEENNMSETIAMVRAPQLLILSGPHGAGFTNMIFAPQNSMILELHPHWFVMGKPYEPLFAQLARDCGHFHAVAIGKTGTGFNFDAMEFMIASIYAAMFYLKGQLESAAAETFQ